MARPRVFVSSTYYDLKQVRGNLNSFIRQIGYEPILNEAGAIPYGKEHPLDRYCYNEVKLCDILVAVIGGRFGAKASENNNSITQEEIVHAHKEGKQVYFFVDKAVMSEYQTYLMNKGNEHIKYASVDNPAIFEFLEFINALPSNNPIHPFEHADDIITFLREQWAGLFQRFLQDQARQSEFRALEKIEKTAQTLDRLVKFLTEERRDKEKAIQEILLSNHPAMNAIRECLGTKMRLYFQNVEELEACIEAFKYIPLFFDVDDKAEEFLVWKRNLPDEDRWIYVNKKIFDENKNLCPFNKESWLDTYIRCKVESKKLVCEDDLPF